MENLPESLALLSKAPRKEWGKESGYLPATYSMGYRETERGIPRHLNKGEEEKICIPKVLNFPRKKALTFLTYKQFWDITIFFSRNRK